MKAKTASKAIVAHLDGKQTKASKAILATVGKALTKAGFKAPFTIREAIDLPNNFDTQMDTPDEKEPIYFIYYINLDERGEFYADVRPAGGLSSGYRGPENNSVFEINTDKLVELVQDGFMKNKEDIAGLTELLIEIGIIPLEAEIITEAQYEREMEARTEDRFEQDRFTDETWQR